MRSTTLRLSTFICSLALVGWLVFGKNWDASSVASVVSFILAGIWALVDVISVEPQEESSLTRTTLASRLLGAFIFAWKTVRNFGALLLLIVLGLSVAALKDVSAAISAHEKLETQEQVEVWATSLQTAVIASVALLVCLFVYAAWKFKSTRFSEARFTLMKDLLLEVREIRSGHKDGWEAAIKQAEELALSSLHSLLEQSVWRGLRRVAARVTRRHACTRVELLAWSSEDSAFRLKRSYHAKDFPNRALQAHKIIQEEYKAARFDPREFDRRVAIAKGARPRGWKDRFMNQDDRSGFTSAAGYVAATGEVLFVNDVNRCLVYDETAYEMLRSRGFTLKEISWNVVESFIACPVAGEPGTIPEVLFVSSNVPSAFVPEDREIVIAVAQLLSIATRKRRIT